MWLTVQIFLSFFQSRKNGKQNGTPQYISTNFLLLSKVENNVCVGVGNYRARVLWTIKFKWCGGKLSWTISRVRYYQRTYHVCQRKPQWLRQNDRYRVHRIMPGNFQTCKRFEEEETNLMSQFIKFYFTSSMFNMFRILIYPSSGACDFSVASPRWLRVLISTCVGVSVWLVGVVSV